MNLRPAPCNGGISACRVAYFLASVLLAMAASHGAFAQFPAKPEARRAIDLRIVGKRIEEGPTTVRLVRGEKVVLRWLSDEALDIHVHGYDIELALSPGVTGTMPFDARVAGRFPVTAHVPAAQREKKGADKSHREPTLLYLEVHPE